MAFDLKDSTTSAPGCSALECSQTLHLDQQHRQPWYHSRNQLSQRHKLLKASLPKALGAGAIRCKRRVSLKVTS